MDLIKQKNCFKTPVTGPMLDLSSSKGRVDDEQEVPSSPQGNEPSSPDLADLGLPASPTGTSTVTEDMLEEKSQKLDDKEEKDAAKDSRVSNQKWLKEKDQTTGKKSMVKQRSRAMKHTTPKCHTPQKPTKPRSKKRKLHPKQLVYSDKAPEGTENPETSMTTKKKKQPKSSSKKSIYEFTDETRPSSPAISSTRKPKKQGKKRMSKRKHFLSREIEEQGTWVQCTADKCNKWRYLADVTDPTTVPDKWTCSMNPG
uniref:CW-type domain-containing protein n=1 Tax=Branchiostoma floridae TaxID=7739 RepID=C3XPH8_BRAFL|eukprot:XP_002613840.1 hypothetical protein BRAFLDRAFT_72038 [Branchiostoma floridae]